MRPPRIVHYWPINNTILYVICDAYVKELLPYDNDVDDLTNL